MVKTLGQIACEGGGYYWPSNMAGIAPSKKEWEAAAQAVREAVIEECAKVCDEQAALPECPERATYCAEAIRALKDKK